MNYDMVLFKEEVLLVKNSRLFISGTPGVVHNGTMVPVVLMISSYPPRQCGIATYSQDLAKALQQQFGQSFQLKMVALENAVEHHQYPEEVEYTLNTDREESFL